MFTFFTFVPRGDIDYHVVRLLPPTSQSSEFVLHAVLGISALHLTSLHSETNRTKYQNLALEHLCRGTSSFRTTVDRVDPRNTDAIFMFSGMSILFQMALMHPAYKPYLSEQSPIDQLLHVFILWRRVFMLRQSFPESFRQGILPGNKIEEGMTDAQRSKIKKGRLAQLQHFGILVSELDALVQRLHSLNQATATDAAEVQIYAEAIDLLHLTFSNFIRSPGHWSLALLWPSRMSISCVEDMRARRPFALLLLAHYCALLHLGTNSWWMREWDRSVLSAIAQSLDDQWIKHMSWAVQAVQDSCQ
jgi:Fungal specific transcription factor domain